MKKHILIITFIIFSFNLFNQTLPYGDKHWQLVFNEDFNDYPFLILKIVNKYDNKK